MVKGRLSKSAGHPLSPPWGLLLTSACTVLVSAFAFVLGGLTDGLRWRWLHSQHPVQWFSALLLCVHVYVYVCVSVCVHVCDSSVSSCLGLTCTPNVSQWVCPEEPKSWLESYGIFLSSLAYLPLSPGLSLCHLSATSLPSSCPVEAWQLAEPRLGGNSW